ncbi:hypothetical protein PMZ80_008127 [Knufia obscura]|uniref:Retrotransposon gag domain-containing protein n=2 Tax=Knufia TaxID=430999 RepID=A0AAN8F5N3_9EURO|nr:hypothetical protein PMZ80_008127 [Knufia obscura]KAK5957148.1 hypothetical protein OHC33_001517 [Knufia fluminis]
MPQARATAQQAIEVLKVHQLRKENVIIFEEVKHLRGEVTSRQNELNDALRQIADLKTQLKDVVDKTGEYDKKLEALGLATGRVDNDVADLRRDQEQVKDELTNKLEAQQATAEKTGRVTEKLREEVEQLRKQIDDSENKTAGIIDDMNQDLNAKAEQQGVIELGERLDQLIDDLELRLRTHENVSRVTDTAEELVERTSGNALSSDDQYDDSMWKPIGGPTEAQTNVRQEEGTKEVSENQIETQPISAVPPHVEVSPKRNMISNIPHDLPLAEGPPPAMAVDGHHQYQTVPKQAAKQQNLHEIRGAHQAPPMPQQPASRPRTSLQSMRQVLYNILKLKQQEEESLAEYFSRFQKVMEAAVTDAEVVTICLRRFMNGFLHQEEQELLCEWLNTGEYSLQAARDCMTLLSYCGPDGGTESSGGLDQPSRPVVGFGSLVTTIANDDEPKNQENAQHTDVEEGGLVARRDHEEVTDGRLPRFPRVTADPTATASNVLRSGVTTRSAAARQRDKTGEGKETQLKKATKHNHKGGKRSGACQSKKRQPKSKASKQTAAGRVSKPNTVKATIRRAVTPEIPVVTSQTPRMLVELEDFMPAPQAQMVIEGPVTPMRPTYKGRGILDPPKSSNADNMPSSPPTKTERLPQTPVRHSPQGHGGKLSRVPTLVPPVRARSVIPETSDPICLPPVRPQKGHEEEPMKVDQPGKKRKTRHDTPPEIPILTLTPSDFAG